MAKKAVFGPESHRVGQEFGIPVNWRNQCQEDQHAEQWNHGDRSRQYTCQTWRMGGRPPDTARPVCLKARIRSSSGLWARTNRDSTQRQSCPDTGLELSAETGRRRRRPLHGQVAVHPGAASVAILFLFRGGSRACCGSDSIRLWSGPDASKACDRGGQAACWPQDRRALHPVPRPMPGGVPLPWRCWPASRR